MDTQENPRSRIIWKSDFTILIKNKLPDWFDIYSNNKEVNHDVPKIRFKKDNFHSDLFQVEFINPLELLEDVDLESIEEIVVEVETKAEGKAKYVYSEKYERDSKNRELAIQIHRTKCIICDFDFEKVYGERGRGYIEIHHVKPLSTLEEEIKIDPKTDLVPVCSNCHKMIHRRKDNILPIEDMKNILQI